MSFICSQSPCSVCSNDCFRSANNTSAPLTNGEANDDFNESVNAENKNINRSNSKSLTGGRDTSRKGRDGDKKSDKDAGKDNLSLRIYSS